MSSIFSLPPVPAELKPILPYLQRAEELKSQEPIISYWCAYYAAQVGIGLKARNPSAKEVLFALLGVLEQMKANIGAADAIDIESVSAAYVENFSLKIFTNADNEDRNGRATRSTAKKFLAAANFLEVLKTFPKTDISEANEEKIKYAKWKAADIAKAFREGRKPLPGPPGWAEEQEELNALAREQEGQYLPSPPSSTPRFATDPSPPRSMINDGTPSRSSYIPSSPPSKRSPVSQSPPKQSNIGHGAHNAPESWSTTSTPGLEAPENFSLQSTLNNSSSPLKSGITHARQVWEAKEGGNSKPRSGSTSSSNSASSRGLPVKHTPSSTPPKSSFKSGSPDSDKRVHFSPSTAGSPPPPPPQLPPSLPKEYIGPSSIYAHPPPKIPVSPPIHPPPVSPPSNSYGYGHPPGHPALSPYPRAPPPVPPVMPTPPVELTPALVAKAQKHCRFAISALDYEDAEQAKKELRAALALLGG